MGENGGCPGGPTVKTAFASFMASMIKLVAVVALIGLALVLLVVYSSSSTTLHVGPWQCRFWNHGWPPHIHCQR